MNNVFISSTKKNEVVENFVKSKREELEKMIPGFIGDRKFTDIVLNFYERGIRDGAQMMLGTLEIKEVDSYNNGWIDCTLQMPKETKQTSDTLQGHKEWTESDLVLAWDSS
jgi:hypothetical protein